MIVDHMLYLVEIFDAIAPHLVPCRIHQGAPGDPAICISW